MRTLGVPASALLAALLMPGLAGADGNVDPKQECLVASDQGQNQRDDGLYRAARASFVSCSRAACPAVVAQSCTRWLREVEQATPTVVLGAKDPQGNDLTDVAVSFDGKAFAWSLDGKPIEVDAGEHVLRFERMGSLPVEQKLLLRAGEKARVVTVVLQPVPATSPVPSPAVGPAGRGEPVLSPRHVTAGALVVGALAAAGAGGLFVAASNRHQSNAQGLRANLSPYACTLAPSTTCQSLNEEATSQHHDANLAVGLFTGAGVLAAGAVVSWLLWPRSDASQPQTQAQTVASLTPVPGGMVLGVTGGLR